MTVLVILVAFMSIVIFISVMRTVNAVEFSDTCVDRNKIIKITDITTRIIIIMALLTANVDNVFYSSNLDTSN